METSPLPVGTDTGCAGCRQVRGTVKCESIHPARALGELHVDGNKERVNVKNTKHTQSARRMDKLDELDVDGCKERFDVKSTHVHIVVAQYPETTPTTR